MQKTLTLRIYQSVGSLKKKSKNTAATQMVRHPELVSGSIVRSEMLKQVQHDQDVNHTQID